MRKLFLFELLYYWILHVIGPLIYYQIRGEYIYIYKLISLYPFKPAKTRQEREKSLLSHPEVRSFTSRTSWFDTSKSLVSYTEVPCFKAHPDIARSSSSAAPGLPPIQLDNRYQLMPASNPDRKGPSIPATRNA